MRVTALECQSDPFNGYWFSFEFENQTINQSTITTQMDPSSNIDLRNDNTNNMALECLAESCNDSFLVSQIETCPDQTLRVSTPNAVITLTMPDTTLSVCVFVRINSSSILAFAEPATKAVGMTFVRVNGSDVKNEFSVIQNEKRYVVGQMMSDVITIERDFPEYFDMSQMGSVPTIVDICFECIFCSSNGDDNDGDGGRVDPRFTVFDIGRNISEVGFRAMGIPISMTIEDGDNQLVCFSDVVISDTSTKLVLVKRMKKYENYNVITAMERGVLLCSCALYGVGGVMIVMAQVAFCSLYIKVNLILIAGLSICLMVIRSVYFGLIAENSIRSGSMTDYILVEIPTFFYLQILVQILVSVYRFTDSASILRTSSIQMRKVEEQKTTSGWGVMALWWLIVWIGFGCVVFGLSQVKTTATIDKYCDCRMSDVLQPSNIALYVRIGCKSVILILSLFVFVMMIVFGRSLLARSPSIFYQIVITSFFLCLNCIAFVIYYSVNQPTPYFVIVLWFTELIPILCLNLVISEPGIKFARTWLRSNLRTHYETIS